MGVQIPMQNYKSMSSPVVIILATLVNTQMHTDRQTGFDLLYYKLSQVSYKNPTLKDTVMSCPP